MKAILKHISLLIISGLIIPLYQSNRNTDKPAAQAKQIPCTIPAARQDTAHYYFSFMHDVAAKLVPVVNFFHEL